MDIAAILEKVAHFRQQENYRQAIKTIQPASETSSNIEVQWVLAELCWEFCNLNASVPAVARSCKDKLQAHLNANPGSGRSHKSLALLMLMDRDAVLDRKGLLHLGKVKRHMEQAVRLLPRDGYSRYMMGMYCFEMATAPMSCTRLVTWLIGSQPTITLEDALSYFNEAVTLASAGDHDFNCSGAHLMAAQCHFKLGRKADGAESLARCIAAEEQANTRYRLNTKFAQSIACVKDVDL